MKVPRRRKHKRLIFNIPKVAKPPQANKSLFINRELSWLEFNKRVLEQALDENIPLLDRVRFLGIFQSNLDEFFMKRVGLLRRNLQSQTAHISKDGLTAADQFILVRDQVTSMLTLANAAFGKAIRPALTKSNIHLLHWGDLKDEEKTVASQIFRERIFLF